MGCGCGQRAKAAREARMKKLEERALAASAAKTPPEPKK